MRGCFFPPANHTRLPAVGCHPSRGPSLHDLPPFEKPDCFPQKWRQQQQQQTWPLSRRTHVRRCPLLEGKERKEREGILGKEDLAIADHGAGSGWCLQPLPGKRSRPQSKRFYSEVRPIQVNEIYSRVNVCIGLHPQNIEHSSPPLKNTHAEILSTLRALLVLLLSRTASDCSLGCCRGCDPI